jgi:hypothetical protein
MGQSPSVSYPKKRIPKPVFIIRKLTLKNLWVGMSGVKFIKILQEGQPQGIAPTLMALTEKTAQSEIIFLNVYSK